MPKSKEFLSSSDSESGDSDEPKQKKKKPEAKPEKKKEAAQAAQTDKDGKASKSIKGPGGEYMFQLAKMRYATVSEFRGKVMVGIREYYEKDGELRPGKKGISLSADQWQALKDTIADIDECVTKF